MAACQVNGVVVVLIANLHTRQFSCQIASLNFFRIGNMILRQKANLISCQIACEIIRLVSDAYLTACQACQKGEQQPARVAMCNNHCPSSDNNILCINNIFKYQI